MALPDYDPTHWEVVADLIADAGLKPPAPTRTPHTTGYDCWCCPMVYSVSHAMGLWHIGSIHTTTTRKEHGVARMLYVTAVLP